MSNTKTKKAETNAKNSNGKSSSNGNGSKNNNGVELKTFNSRETSSQLDKFFLNAVKDIYWAEKHLTKALPKMKKAATSEKLQQAIASHLVQTEGHVNRLEKVFELLEEKPKAKKCEAMEGLSKEGESIVEETKKGSATRDVGIIAASQKIEHYEIATYGTLVKLSKTMGNNEIADILAETLDEEKQADELLSQIADNDINWNADKEVEKN